MKKFVALGSILILFFGLQVHAASITFLDGVSGNVPNTSITYSIISNRDELTNVVAGQTFDGEYTWASQGVGHRKLGGDLITTVTFSSPVPINAFTTMVVDFETGMDTISISGGTADTQDLTLDTGFMNPATSTDMLWDDTTGQLTVTNTSRHDAHLVGNSTDTLLSLTHTASNVAPGDFTIVHFGIIDNIVPEPASSTLLLSVVGIAFACRRRR